MLEMSLGDVKAYRALLHSSRLYISYLNIKPLSVRHWRSENQCVGINEIYASMMVGVAQANALCVCDENKSDDDG